MKEYMEAFYRMEKLIFMSKNVKIQEIFMQFNVKRRYKITQNDMNI